MFHGRGTNAKSTWGKTDGGWVVRRGGRGDAGTRRKARNREFLSKQGGCHAPRLAVLPTETRESELFDRSSSGARYGDTYVGEKCKVVELSHGSPKMGTGTEPGRFPAGLASVHARSQSPFSTPRTRRGISPVAPPGRNLTFRMPSSMLFAWLLQVYLIGTRSDLEVIRCFNSACFAAGK